MSKFDELFALNVNDKVEKRKNGSVELSYLSWAWAWAKFKSVYPDAKYEIKKFEHYANSDFTTLLPYMFDEKTGYMVQTEIIADGLRYEMWLPVMDSSNRAMKRESYTYTTKQGQKTVEAATMFDINKTIMRCLVKNMAMFGLGLYIYAGEDLPDSIDISDVDVSDKEVIELINNAKTNEELRKIYRTNKAKMTKDGKLLDLITNKSNELKKKAS